MLTFRPWRKLYQYAWRVRLSRILGDRFIRKRRTVTLPAAVNGKISPRIWLTVLVPSINAWIKTSVLVSRSIDAMSLPLKRLQM